MTYPRYGCRYHGYVKEGYTCEVFFFIHGLHEFGGGYFGCIDGFVGGHIEADVAFAGEGSVLHDLFFLQGAGFGWVEVGHLDVPGGLVAGQDAAFADGGAVASASQGRSGVGFQ